MTTATTTATTATTTTATTTTTTTATTKTTTTATTTTTVIEINHHSLFLSGRHFPNKMEMENNTITFRQKLPFRRLKWRAIFDHAQQIAAFCCRKGFCHNACRQPVASLSCSLLPRLLIEILCIMRSVLRSLSRSSLNLLNPAPVTFYLCHIWSCMFLPALASCLAMSIESFFRISVWSCDFAKERKISRFMLIIRLFLVAIQYERPGFHRWEQGRIHGTKCA